MREVAGLVRGTRVRRAVGVAAGCAVAACGAAALGTACSNAGSPLPVDAGAAVEASLAPAGDVEEAGPPDAGRGSLTKLGATTQTSILDGPWWPETGKGQKRIGYLRHGATIAAYDQPTINTDCKEGWYELAAGGFVCGKAVSADLTGPRLRLAPKQPDHDAGMPYRYGVNLADDTPLYRRILPAEERKKYEPWLAPKPAPAAEESGAANAAAAGEEKAEAAPREPEEESGGTSSSSAMTRRTEPKDAGVDAGRPKLKELKGRGVLVRKMARGFYLALDREFKSTGARWWRTSFGFAVPFERIMLQPGVTKYVGSWFGEAGTGTGAEADAGAGAWGDAGAWADAGADPDASAGADASAAATASAGADAGTVAGAGTVGFVHVGFARKIDVSADRKKVTWAGELPKRSAVLLDGREATVSGATYHGTTSGFWVRVMDLQLARPAPPADLRANEKWIDVDLTRQSLVAFEGARPVFATLISSGKRNPQDKERDFPTPTGSFRIREKHVTTTMDGDVASDGPYSIEDVPWVMYFQGSYALHGAFWHDSFGRMRSHGCVNMAPEDARALFAWSDPPLPAGWHGVFSTDDASGTRIIVHEDAKPKR